MEEKTNMVMERIVDAIREAGYEPYDQLTGFLHTHDERYITRHGNARNLVRQVEWGVMMRYVNQMKRPQ